LPREFHLCGPWLSGNDPSEKPKTLIVLGFQFCPDLDAYFGSQLS
jgi:hypothetical protein